MFQYILDDKENKILTVLNRRKLFELVHTYAGTHFREIQRMSNLPMGTVRYHLAYLSKHNLVHEEKVGKSIRYFPKQIAVEHTPLLGFLRQKSLRNIILFILTHDLCTHEAIVHTVALSPSTVSWHLNKLEEKHIIASIKKGRNTFYKLLVDKSIIMNFLITYQESFLDALVDRVIEMWDIPKK